MKFLEFIKREYLLLKYGPVPSNVSLLTVVGWYSSKDLVEECKKRAYHCYRQIMKEQSLL
jgi:hypothetical protein